MRPGTLEAAMAQHETGAASQGIRLRRSRWMAAELMGEVGCFQVWPQDRENFRK